MKRIITLLVCVAVLGIAGAASAQQASKIGKIDIVRCATTSDAGIKANETLRAMEAELQGKLKPMNDELTAMQNDYISQEKLLTEPAKKAKMDAIQKKGAEMENAARTYNMDLQRKEQELMNKILKDLEKIVADVAKDGKFTMVLRAEAVVYPADMLDITTTVIDKYNQQLKQK